MGSHQIFCFGHVQTQWAKVLSHLYQQKQGGQKNVNGMDISLQNKIMDWKLC